MLRIFCPYLKEYNPQTAKRRVTQRYTYIHIRELNKHYAKYFSLTPEAKRSLARSLGIPVVNLRIWMRRKREKEKALQITKDQLQNPYKQEHGTRITGVYAYIYMHTLAFYL